MKEWIPNACYGGHAFGKDNFAQFLAERESILPWIAEYSPCALVSAGDPPVCLFYHRKTARVNATVFCPPFHQLIPFAKRVT